MLKRNEVCLSSFNLLMWLFPLNRNWFISEKKNNRKNIIDAGTLLNIISITKIISMKINILLKSDNWNFSI